MLPGSSAPPRFSGFTWSMTNPLQVPDVLPVDGHGWDCRNVRFATALRWILPRELRAHEVHFVARAWPAEERGKAGVTRKTQVKTNRNRRRIMKEYIGRDPEKLQMSRSGN